MDNGIRISDSFEYVRTICFQGVHYTVKMVGVSQTLDETSKPCDGTCGFVKPRPLSKLMKYEWSTCRIHAHIFVSIGAATRVPATDVLMIPTRSIDPIEREEKPYHFVHGGQPISHADLAQGQLLHDGETYVYQYADYDNLRINKVAMERVIKNVGGVIVDVSHREIK